MFHTTGLDDLGFMNSLGFLLTKIRLNFLGGGTIVEYQMLKLFKKTFMMFLFFMTCMILIQNISFNLGAKTMENSHMNSSVTNKLIHEKSPYLLQHAHNPVDWYPWGDEAFEKAQKENKPIFLSIGYSTCHWCHVMAHESFEDADVAKLLNDAFISIKVDREERPDIDNIYMQVCQLMTGSGGWPLTIVMTPDKRPFFAATYIPKENRYQRMGLMELIPKIKKLWETDQTEIVKSADRIVTSLNQDARVQPSKNLDENILNVAYDQLSSRYDTRYAGFGNAPKFPSAQNLIFLLRQWKRTGSVTALNMVEKTLQAMRNGGIYDHIGYGFHRYSTDAQWIVPHYEKMLYDQAMLAIVYIEAYQATGKKEYERTAREIFTYVNRDMTSPEGGFYSAEDADSEGAEGVFYLWTKDEIHNCLNEKDADLIINAFNIKLSGEAKGEENLAEATLHLTKTVPELASQFKISEQEVGKIIQESLQKLFEVREKRIHPHKDDKILTDWNGLMIAALAKGSRVFNEPKYAEAAGRAVDFVLNKLRRSDKRLLHRYRDGDAAQLAYVDDYSFFIWGLLELYETTFDTNYLKTAFELNVDLLKYFWDEKGGAFFFTADDSEKLLIRQKEFYDGAIPSGNSVAMLNTLRLARISGDEKLENKAFEISAAFSTIVQQAPSAYTQFMVGLNFVVAPSYEIVIVGDADADDTKKMVEALRAHFVPNKVVLFKESNKTETDIVKYASFTKDHKSLGNKATAYVCLDYSCKAPTTDVGKMLELINAK